MSIVRISRKLPYTAIPNVVIEAHELSFKARGLLCYLLSKPDYWETNTHRLAKEAKKDGRDSILTAMKELQKAGFAKVVKSQDEKGHFSSRWVIYDYPNFDEPELDYPTSENPTGAGLSDFGLSDFGKPDSSVITELVTTDKKDKDSNANALLRRAEKSTALRWPDDDLWLLKFLQTQEVLTLVTLPLEHKWWDSVSIACSGISESFLKVEFAKIESWLIENPNRKPTPRGAKRFIRTWLERAHERERRFRNGKTQ